MTAVPRPEGGAAGPGGPARPVAGAGAAARGTAPPLLAVAHGSRDPRAATTVQAIMQRVRDRRPELRTETCYLDHAPPTVGQALSTLAADGVGSVVVLPLLLTAAYHSNTDIPRALSQARDRLGRPDRLDVHPGACLGPHPALTDALERRLAEAGVPAGDPQTAVVLTAAGSSDAGANATIAELARTWRRRGWWSAVAAYASATAPTPAEAVRELRGAGAPRVAVASYLLAPGYFADKVRTESLAAGADAVAPVLGAAPEMAAVVVERYEQALHGSGENLVAV